MSYQGKPVQIVVSKSKNQLSLNMRALKDILLNNEVKDKHAVVISVAGAFRKGKSFILDFFLRYMYALCENYGQHDDGWLGSYNDPLKGFDWRPGAERHTMGIVMWSQPFLIPIPKTGEEVAVLFMDTQGTFDQESSLKECAMVFALSSMCSSIQIFNLSENITENDLMYLQYFSAYGLMAVQQKDLTPFQNLMFLVRDWPFAYEITYGLKGGKQLLDKRFYNVSGLTTEHEMIRQDIRRWFREITCFLLPHPGVKAVAGETFDGKLRSIEHTFLEYLKELIPLVVHPDNLHIKEIAGQQIKCKDLFQHFVGYMTMFNSDKIPQPMTLFEATAHGCHVIAAEEAKTNYVKLMENVCGGRKPYISPQILQEKHILYKDKSIEMFNKKPKFGSNEYAEQYREKLGKEIDNYYSSYKSYNSRKSIIKMIITPVLLFVMVILCYVMSFVFAIFAQFYLALISSSLMMLFLISLLIWAFANFRLLSSQFSDVLSS